VLLPNAVVELVWQDSSGSTSATTLNCASSLTVEDIDASATALASILLPLTECSLVKQRISYKWHPDEPVVASGGASITRTGSFFFNTEDLAPIAQLVVKAIKSSIIETEGPRAGYGIDVTDSDVITFIDAVIDNNVVNVFGDDVTEFITAYMQSRL